MLSALRKLKRPKASEPVHAIPAGQRVYAVGDIVRGASLVVWAIKDGRDCAQAILEKMGASVAIAAE